MIKLCIKHQHQVGFTYLGLLIFISILGMTSATSIKVGALVQRRAAEQELLAIGHEMRLALISYANATPFGQSRRPTSLQDLLKDPRYPSIKRHLRQIYTDPITGKSEWGQLLAADGKGIVGIHSLSSATPIKLAQFDAEFATFEGKTSYREWLFIGIQ
jgi:type II secretory pathway pseudopilin PulG